jgi:hypothetical protein
MFAKRGEGTPPTILQTFFFKTGCHGSLINPEHHMDQVLGHFHPLHQGADSRPLAQPVSRLQPRAHPCRKIFEAPNDQAQLRLHGGGRSEALALLLQLREALPQAGDPGFAFLFLDEPLRVTVDQPGEALLDLPELRLQGGLLLGRGLCWRMQAPAVFFCQPFRMGEQHTHFAPHGQL